MIVLLSMLVATAVLVLSLEYQDVIIRILDKVVNKITSLTDKVKKVFKP